MHLVKFSAQEKGRAVITTKCGEKVGKEEATIWWRDVDCTECVPYRFAPAEDGLGLKMKRVDPTPAPNVKVMRRRRPKG